MGNKLHERIISWKMQNSPTKDMQTKITTFNTSLKALKKIKPNSQPGVIKKAVLHAAKIGKQIVSSNPEIVDR